MLVLAMLIAQASPPPAPVAEPVPDEVTVTAQRLKRFRAILRKDKATGQMRCHVRRASGDPALDQGVCDAMLACAPKITRESDIRPCMEPAMQQLIPKHTWTGRRTRRLD